jgi:gamma-glutamyl:cysteine ligase YbdK (ATP-grasp superfamily)
MKPVYHLFDGFGVELEYMIVDKDTLAVKPMADELLKHALGKIGSDFENGMVTWSNELVLHVIEIKSTHPEKDLQVLEKSFTRNVAHINSILAEWNAQLLPSAAHPFMDPLKESELWPHDNNEVYGLYDTIFNAKGHGWSNLQSTHLNLPFHGDTEFAKLHAAARIVLPLLPALCASSPMLSSKLTGMLDTRLYYYKTNQQKLPAITGKIIPEPVFSEADYHNTVYIPIANAISTHDPDNLLDPVWVNSRGAMSRFDRGSIEIRIMDIQECPAIDLAIISTVVELLQALVNEKFASFETQKVVDTELLARIFESVTYTGLDTKVDEPEFLKLWNLNNTATLKEIWLHILNALKPNDVVQQINREKINFILTHGSLAQRIVKALGTDADHEKIVSVYQSLAQCLQRNEMFVAS